MPAKHATSSSRMPITTTCAASRPSRRRKSSQASRRACGSATALPRLGSRAAAQSGGSTRPCDRAAACYHARLPDLRHPRRERATRTRRRRDRRMSRCEWSLREVSPSFARLQSVAWLCPRSPTYFSSTRAPCVLALLAFRRRITTGLPGETTTRAARRSRALPSQAEPCTGSGVTRARSGPRLPRRSGRARARAPGRRHWRRPPGRG